MDFLLNIDALAKISQILLGIVGAVAIYLSWGQLKATKRNTQLNIAKNEIDIFSKLNEKQKIFVDSMALYNANTDNKSARLNALKAKEEYFWLLDIVCLYVLNKSITPHHFYTQYRQTIYELLKIFPNDFGADSAYKNILKILEA